MTEVSTKDGTWTFELDAVRIAPGPGAHPLRQALGAITVPLAAIETLGYEAARKGGALRLRPRPGADPLLQVAGDALPEAADPYRLAVDPSVAASARYFAQGVLDARLVAQVPDGPTAHYLLPVPRVPLTARGEDGTASFDGRVVLLEWNWLAEAAKTAAGPREIRVEDLDAVEWRPTHLRFRPRGAGPVQKTEHDPNCLTVTAFSKKQVTGTALLAAAVAARLPHPFAAPPDTPAPALLGAPAADPDAVLRRLRELGDLHRDGVLTDEEFTAAKQAVLRAL